LCIFRIFLIFKIIYLCHHLLLYQVHCLDSELNVWYYQGQQTRRWCACTALGRYSQQEIDRYQVCMQLIHLRSKRQFCCASWHLHKKIKIISPCHHNLVVGVKSEEIALGGNLFWFILIILLKWWNDEKSHPTYLLALRSNPVTQLEHERITHRNMKVFIIFWIFFSLPVFLFPLYKTMKCQQQPNNIGSNRILTNPIRNEWTTIRQMT
jgi:hypothetical protein